MSELADASKQEQGVQVSYSIYRIYQITIPPVGRCCLSPNGLQRSSVNFKVNAVQFHPGLIVQNIQYILLMRSIHVYINLRGSIDGGRNSCAIIMPHLVDEIMYRPCMYFPKKKSRGKGVGVVVDLKNRTSCYP